MEKIQSRDGTTIAFDQIGEGVPLVLVAGASCDRAIDTPTATALAEHFTVLNYDRRGRGDSTDTLPFAVEREVEDIAALIAAAGGSATLVGTSVPIDSELADQIRSLVATGFLGPGSLATDDCRATYAELKARGVEFTDEPEERFYGIDAGFRDPFGNQWRLTQPKPRAGSVR